jgi:hypothetical protein
VGAPFSYHYHHYHHTIEGAYTVVERISAAALATFRRTSFDYVGAGLGADEEGEDVDGDGCGAFFSDRILCSRNAK